MVGSWEKGTEALSRRKDYRRRVSGAKRKPPARVAGGEGLRWKG
jgi:hypothetical protein